ncbi:SpvB/TcaC N-terminal domain-containing protein [Pseudomonas orientalis]|uniref:SpvB/TcaC N-terminal domain-containing protein n=1 Tax=Pseudomonas orientalis TaxID=76758 RepID=UPI0034D55069
MLNNDESVQIATPSLPKGGGAIQSIGNGLGSIGTSGDASFELPLPISVGRGFAPDLALGYSSSGGNSPFGIGWSTTPNAITRRTSTGVPAYTDNDVILGPDGEPWMPERNPTTGAQLSRVVTAYNGLPVGPYTVVRHWPRIEGAFALIEHWSDSADPAGFWLIHSADGNLHVYGKTAASRRVDPLDDARVGAWLLDESLNPRGEHIVYQYQADDGISAQRYLSKVLYGNALADDQLYAWRMDGWQGVLWHFHLVFDHGERPAALLSVPPYEATSAWPGRGDPFSSYAYGFELRTRQLCRQVLMFHCFPEEPDMGPVPVLVRRLVLEYRPSPLGYSLLHAAHEHAVDREGKIQSRPPLEFTYNRFELAPDPRRYQAFEKMPGLNDGQRYQFVDLYGEGLPGILYTDDKAWYYRAPMRAKATSDLDEVAYDDWHELPEIPVADRLQAPRQFLSEITGDGCLEWLVAQPGLCGFFTCNPDRSWSNFATLDAFPHEFFHPQGQLANLMGAGLSDLAMIGPRSVRLYANLRRAGFAPATQVPRQADEDDLPLISNAATELVAFSDVLGSGQQHLIRIRHNQLQCWPNLGRGRFGKGFTFSALDFAYDAFDASRVLLADLDGSGAADLIYLKAECALVFMNRGGNGFDTAVELPWPEGVLYDRFCQVSTADLQGLGCSSLVLTVPHKSPRHWRYDFVTAKPYLLGATNNNLGAAASVKYRSSAQEWLDEKQQLLASNQPAVCRLPFPVPVVSEQLQFDEITRNRLTQRFEYRKGFYDGLLRTFRGFALLLETDADVADEELRESGFSEPVLRKTWFHVGQAIDPAGDDYFHGDQAAHPLGATLLSCYHEADGVDELVVPKTDDLPGMLQALAGQVMRVETYGGRNACDVPYAVEQSRYLIRVLDRPVGGQFAPYKVMLALALESIAYQYEQQADDPQCQHEINLRWDAFGSLTHGVRVSYARRLKAQNDPACQLDPNEIAPQKRWWCDAHDAAQQVYYLSENLEQYIHLTDPQGWRLHLPFQQRENALVLGKGPGPKGLQPKAISYEAFIAQTDVNPLSPKAQRTLVGQSVQRYRDRSGIHPSPDGEATFLALADELEIAELDETALKAYDLLRNDAGEMPFDLEQKLLEVGYHKMPLVLPSIARAQGALWSVKRGFNTYAGLAGFYNTLTVQQTRSHGVTQLSYDPYGCLNTRVHLPDGCETYVDSIDYRLLQPARVIDPNQNTREVLFGAFGQVIASSFYGTELGAAVGFAPLSDYLPLLGSTPSQVIEAADTALQDAAIAHFEDPFSWMGRVPDADLQDRQWLDECVARGDLLPSGHIRAPARLLLPSDALTPARQRLLSLIPQVRREPVHAVSLQADRYPLDPEKQIRITLGCWDGFGRALQSKQKVERGYAYHVQDDGSLALDDEGRPVMVQDVARWRVSERIEYNNKGLAVRMYRPYFADHHRYINDVSFRQHGYSDRQFYDPLGRPTRTVLAKEDYLRRHTYWPWYSIYEDENDTYEEVMAMKEAQGETLQ